MKIQSLLGLSYILCNLFPLTGFAQNSLELAKELLVQDPWLKHASIAVCVVDLDNGAKLVSHNDHVSLPPASTVKLFATASAIELLGAQYKPKTRLYAPTKISGDGTIKGDLYIRGGGDISLGSKFYCPEGTEDAFLQKWADSLYGLGLRKIEGSIVGDASEFGYQGVPDGWNWADMGNYYGAGPSGLPIYDNMLRFYIKVGGKLGSKTTLLRIFPEVKGLNFNNYILATNVKGDNSYIYGAPYSLDRFGTGYLPRNSSSFMVKGSIPDPEYQFACELKRIFEARGIVITGEAKGVRNMNLPAAAIRYKSLQLIYTHQGESLKSIAFWTNMKSVNVFAEQILCWIPYAKGSSGDTKTAVYSVEKFWSGKIDDGGLNLKDGSGLSRSNGVTASNFCSLLKYMHLSKNASIFKETLPLAGESGTMSKVCYGKAGHGRIRAKSGTMNKIKAYAGYVTTTNGKQLAFSIIANNYGCTNDAMLDKIEVFMNAMAVY